MKTKVLMLVLAMGFSTILFAQQNEKRQERQPRAKNPEMQVREKRSPEQSLNLTDAQKEAFKQSMLAMRKQMQPVRNELGEAQARQKSLTNVDKPDLAAINKNIEKIGALKVEMAKIQTKHHLEMRAQLTEEQRLKFDMFKHQMREGRGTRN